MIQLVIDAPREDLTAVAGTVQGRITQLEGGILSGTVTSDGSAPIHRIFLSVNGRSLGAIPVDPASNGDGLQRVWYFDARRLPPDLLLDDHLAFEVRLDAASQLAFDTLEVETARLYPFEGLPQGHGSLEGYVDAVDDGTVRGWVWDPMNTARRVKVQLFIDGAFCGTFDASRPRPDLAATGRGDGHYGFSIPARDMLARGALSPPQVRIVSVEPEVWTVPFAPHTRNARGPALPRWHALPATTRDLVAVLASAEPFPKKIYVIDRLTRKMPDAFSADYILLALEFLRVEMVKTAEKPATNWDQRLMAWWRQRIIRGQIRRLAALAEATTATQKLLTRR